MHSTVQANFEKYSVYINLLKSIFLNCDKYYHYDRSEKELRKIIEVSKVTFNNLQQLLINKQVNYELKFIMGKSYVYCSFLCCGDAWAMNKH